MLWMKKKKRKESHGLLYLETPAHPWSEADLWMWRLIWKYLIKPHHQYQCETNCVFHRQSDVTTENLQPELNQNKKVFFGLGYEFDVSNSWANWNSQVHILATPYLCPPLPGRTLGEFLLSKQKLEDDTLMPTYLPNEIKGPSSHVKRDGPHHLQQRKLSSKRDKISRTF